MNQLSQATQPTNPKNKPDQPKHQSNQPINPVNEPNQANLTINIHPSNLVNKFKQATHLPKKNYPTNQPSKHTQPGNTTY